MTTKTCLFLMLAVASVAQAQGQADPSAELRASTVTEAIELNGTASFEVAFELDLGYLVCQGGFAIPIDVALTAPTRVETTASDAIAQFEGALVRVNYPYNYHGQGILNVTLTGEPTQEGLVEFALTYDGSLPENCQTTGTLPRATNTTSIELYPEPPATQDDQTDGGSNPSATAPAGVNQDDASTPGSPLGSLLALLALVALISRHR